MRWILLRDVVARAGSVEPVRTALVEEKVVARDVTFLPAGTRMPDNIIPAEWWSDAEINAAASRATFEMALANFGDTTITHEVTAIGVELEPGAVEALWPAEPKPPPEPARAGGKPGPRPYDMWPDLWDHLKTVVAAEDKFASLSAAARAGVKWLDKNPQLPQPNEDTIRAKLREARKTRPDLDELIAPE